MALETHMKLCVTAEFSRNFFFCAKKWGNGPKMDQNLVYNETLCYLLFSCTNLTFWKILVHEIWAKMFSANEIGRFFNQSYLQNKSMKWTDFLHVDTNSHKVKVFQKMFGWVWSEMGVSSLVMGL